MNIAIIRGDFASEWELQNFRLLSAKHNLTLFTGFRPVAKISHLDWIKVVHLPSPVDINSKYFGRYTIALTNRLFTDAHLLFGLEKLLKGFDIAHCAETYFSYTQQCLNAKQIGGVKRVISTVWENIPFNNEGIYGRKEFKDRAFREIDLFLPVTKGAKQALILEGCNPSKIKVLKPGVNLKQFRPYHRDNRKLRILVVSRLVPEKGINEIVKLFNKLKKKYVNLELAIAGTGPIKPKGVILLGNVDYGDMPGVYSSGDILVHYPIGSKTWAEQYGMVQIEAMACGLPVIALDRGSTKEIIGKGGLVVSETIFPLTLEKLISDTKYRLSLGLKARQFALKHYNANVYSSKLVNIYDKVLHDKS